MIPGGSWRRILEIAACTSWAAASTLRSSVNVKAMVVDPRLEFDVIWSRPAMVRSVVTWPSSGPDASQRATGGSIPSARAVFGPIRRLFHREIYRSRDRRLHRAMLRVSYDRNDAVRTRLQ